MVPARLMHVRAAEVLDGHRVRLHLDDDTQKIVDLAPLLHGPLFAPIRADRTLFRALRVDPELGTIVWPNGADIDPKVLYYDDLEPAWMEHEQDHEQDHERRGRTARRSSTASTAPTAEVR